jgi:hypothetical protein
MGFPILCRYIPLIILSLYLTASGVTAANTRPGSNLFYCHENSSIVFHAAALGIKLDKPALSNVSSLKSKRTNEKSRLFPGQFKDYKQSYFREHDDDILCLAISSDRFVAYILIALAIVEPNINCDKYEPTAFLVRYFLITNLIRDRCYVATGQTASKASKGMAGVCVWATSDCRCTIFNSLAVHLRLEPDLTEVCLLLGCYAVWRNATIEEF